MIRKSLLAATIAIASIAAAPAPVANWLTNVVTTAEKSHIVGDPNAKHMLTEYMSYTCVHCFEFERDGADAIKTQFVGDGRMRFEVRHFILNIADLTVASAVHCLPEEDFFRGHAAMMKSYEQWSPKFFNATRAQRQRYEIGTPKQRLQAVASDIGLYDMMAKQGLGRAELDRCLGNPAIYEPIIAQTDKAAAQGITGTPTFVFDDARLPTNSAAGVASWLGERLNAPK